MTLDEADRTFHSRKYGEALEQYRAVAEADAATRVEALSQVARCLSLLEKLEEGRTVLAQAQRVASKEEPLGWSRFLGVRGIFEREGGDRKKARATFEEMYAYCTERKLHRRAVDAAHHVAIVAPPEEQPAWGMKGIAEAEKLGDEGWLAVLWNNLGGTYEDLKQHEKCLEAYRKAQAYHHKTGGESRKLIADWAVGHALRLCARHGEARELLERTLAWAEKRHAAEKTPENLEWVGWCRRDLGEAVAGLGEKAKGLALVKEGRAALVEAGIEKWWPEGLKKIDESVQALEK